MEVIIIDNRKSIVEKCKEAGFTAIHGDYFAESVRVPRHVLCTASNRSFSMGGGIDLQFNRNFPFYVEEKQKRTGSNERIGNIIFTITVGQNLTATKELVRDALQFAKDSTDPSETLCLCALGTSIGMLKEEVFVELLKEVFA